MTNVSAASAKWCPDCGAVQQGVVELDEIPDREVTVVTRSHQSNYPTGMSFTRPARLYRCPTGHIFPWNLDT